MVHLFAWFLAYAEQMFVSKRRHVLRRWNLSRRREYAREKKKKIAELEDAMSAPSFWDDQDTARKVGSENNRLKQTVSKVE